MPLYYYIPAVFVVVLSFFSIFHKPYKVAGIVICSERLINFSFLLIIPTALLDKDFGALPLAMATNLLLMVIFLYLNAKNRCSLYFRLAFINLLFTVAHLLCIMSYKKVGFEPYLVFGIYYKEIIVGLICLLGIEFFQSGIKGLKDVTKRMGFSNFINFTFGTSSNLDGTTSTSRDRRPSRNEKTPKTN